jgi:amino acid transporter
MGVGQIVFFCVCAVIVLSTLTSSASLGPSGLFWWLVALVAFVIPNSLVLSELGTTYPSEGGTYEWIAQAFGPRMGTRATFFYWISNGIWIASGLILVMGQARELFFPGMGELGQVLCVLALAWLIVLFVCLKVEVGLAVTVIGAIVKTLIVLVLGGAGLYFAAKNGPANEISLSAIAPSLAAGFGFFSVIIYNVTGFELVACMGGVLKNPARDMPKAIVTSAIAVVALYVIGSVGLLLAVPLADLDLVSGIASALFAIFGRDSFVSTAVVVLFMASVMGDLVTWTMAPSRAAAAAAADGHLPRVLGKWHPTFKTPYCAAITQGVVATAITILYSAMATGGQSELFWSIFSFSSALIISSYLPLYAAFFKLRLKDPHRPRPFKVPGGTAGMVAFGGLTYFFIALAVLLFVFPRAFELSVDWSASGPTVAGLIVFAGLGEALIRLSEKKSGADPHRSEPLPLSGTQLEMLKGRAEGAAERAGAPGVRGDGAAGNSGALAGQGPEGGES